LIVIDAERCSGCGTCIDVCPEGAIYLVDEKAEVDRELCRECQSCVAACPTTAIAYLRQQEMPQPEPASVPVLYPTPAAIPVRSQTAQVTMRARVLPLVGATLAWAAREIVPRLADYALESLDRRAARMKTRATPSPSEQLIAGRGGGRGGRQRQHRHRGG
jgi:NAD-dependent dihydropyrimidine dehydrogenase PreA subunit